MAMMATAMAAKQQENPGVARQKAKPPNQQNKGVGEGRPISPGGLGYAPIDQTSWQPFSMRGDHRHLLGWSFGGLRDERPPKPRRPIYNNIGLRAPICPPI